jgi:hypothetical protein
MASPSLEANADALFRFKPVWKWYQKETGTRFALVPYRGFPPEFQQALAATEELGDGATAHLIERALDEVRAQQFRLSRE